MCIVRIQIVRDRPLVFCENAIMPVFKRYVVKEYKKEQKTLHGVIMEVLKKEECEVVS